MANWTFIVLPNKYIESSALGYWKPLALHFIQREMSSSLPTYQYCHLFSYLLDPILSHHRRCPEQLAARRVGPSSPHPLLVARLACRVLKARACYPVLITQPHPHFPPTIHNKGVDDFWEHYFQTERSFRHTVMGLYLLVYTSSTQHIQYDFLYFTEWITQ